MIVVQVHLWLASNELSQWPVALGVEAVLNASGMLSSEASSWQQRHGAQLQRWPVRWLATAAGALAALALKPNVELKGITIESIEVMNNGDLLLLLTGRQADDGVAAQESHLLRPAPQLLVAVDAIEGKVRKWWLLAQASLRPDSMAALLGIGRWIAIAVDESGMRLFLVAGGPRPRVSVVALPAW